MKQGWGWGQAICWGQWFVLVIWQDGWTSVQQSNLCQFYSNVLFWNKWNRKLEGEAANHSGVPEKWPFKRCLATSCGLLIWSKFLPSLCAVDMARIEHDGCSNWCLRTMIMAGSQWSMTGLWWLSRWWRRTPVNTSVRDWASPAAPTQRLDLKSEVWPFVRSWVSTVQNPCSACVWHGICYNLLSVCHMLVLYWIGWIDRDVVWHRGYRWAILHCCKRVQVSLKIRVLPVDPCPKDWT